MIHMTRPIAIASLTLFFCSAGLHAQEPAGVPTFPAAAQTEADEYTRYELLAPETASPATPSGTQTPRFKIFYEETAATPRAKCYFDAFRRVSTAINDTVSDSMH